jgi:hypothetical protein
VINSWPKQNPSVSWKPDTGGMTIRGPVPPAASAGAPKLVSPEIRLQPSVPDDPVRPRFAAGALVAWTLAVSSWLFAGFDVLIGTSDSGNPAENMLPLFLFLLPSLVAFALGWTALGVLLSLRRAGRARFAGFWATLTALGLGAGLMLWLSPVWSGRLLDVVW